MTIIKRCEKEVQGTWADKQLQAATWLDHFVPHYSRLCLSAIEQLQRCPAAHTPIVDASKKCSMASMRRTRRRLLRCCS